MSRWIATFLAGALALLTTLAGTAQAQQGYKLHIGDTVQMEVLEDPTLNRSLLVAPDGRVSAPQAGGIQASGRTLEAVQAEIAAKLAPNFAAKPTVYLALAGSPILSSLSNAPTTPPVIDIFVVGEANKPGKLQLTPGTTVLQAFAEMGGFSKFAATKRIQLRRGAKSYLFDYKAIEAGSNAGTTRLQAGDVIVIPQRKLFE